MNRREIKNAIEDADRVKRFLEYILLSEEKKQREEVPTSTDVSNAYGVIWHYDENRLERVGLCGGWGVPEPAEKEDDEGYSPFDEVLPWSGMQHVIFIDAMKDDEGADVITRDEMVEIPDFWYTAVKNEEEKTWLWAISPKEQEGFCHHPGSGRYIGRYHMSGDRKAAFSTSGQIPLTRITQGEARDAAHARGKSWGIMDLATWSAIQLLYLIEFADFDAQKKLGTGYKDEENWEPGKTGGTDNFKYHTVKRSGKSNSYRCIEDPFSNVFDWIDGFMGCGEGCRISAMDTYTGGRDELEDTGIGLADDGWISGFGYSKDAPWAFIPDASVDDDDRERHSIGDYVWSWPSSLYPAYVGGYFDGSANFGFFYFSAYDSASFASGYLGSRLLKT